MILHELKLSNFGVYGASKQFAFTPSGEGRFNRPITLLRGKNGVGKSTLMEAVRLCLHGSLVLGGRASQAEYEAYLRRRVFKHGSEPEADAASVELSFDIYLNGRKHHYQVTRSWNIRRKRISPNIVIVENDKRLNESDPNTFLRELISPGLLDLFFFDGEKIRTLAAAGESSEALLGDTVKLLLGLHLVEQLDRDLGVYMTRKDVMHELSELTQQLGGVESELNFVGEQIEQLKSQQETAKKRVKSVKGRLRSAERKLRREGSTYADQRAELAKQERDCELKIAAIESSVHELCKGILPFSVAPDLLRDVREQLVRETEYERWRMTNEALGAVRDALIEDGLDEARIDKHFEPYAVAPLSEDQLIHRVSAESRRQMLSWIDEALNETPQQLLTTIADLEQQKSILYQIREKIRLVPDEEQLAPFRERVETIKRELWEAEQTVEHLSLQIESAGERYKQLITEQHYINDQIAKSEADSTPLKLAARTRQLLQKYETRLTQAKLKQVEERLAARFIQLCRKRNFVDRVAIDAETFAVTLYRENESFPRSQLSAGEQQLFAIATLWALREVSRRPMPVIIDTPLSRLDSEHRQAMLTEFFPHVAHQTIILATDAEIDDGLTEELKPAMTHFYQLTFDESLGATETEYIDPRIGAPSLIALEEVTIQ